MRCNIIQMIWRESYFRLEVSDSAANQEAFRSLIFRWEVPAMAMLSAFWTNIFTDWFILSSIRIVHDDKSDSFFTSWVWVHNDFIHIFGSINSIVVNRKLDLLIIHLQFADSTSHDFQVFPQVCSFLLDFFLHSLPITVINQLPLWNNIEISVCRSLPTPEDHVAVGQEMTASQVQLFLLIHSYDFFKCNLLGLQVIKFPHIAFQCISVKCV